MDELFTQATSNATETDPKVAYEALVGDGKKFKSNEDLAKGKLESDRFIEKLQNEMQELRTELSSRLTVEQLMTQLSAKSQGDEDGNRGNPPQSPQNDTQTNAQLTEEAVARLVQQELNRHQNKTREQANTAVVVQKLKESYGDNYVSAMQARLDELGISKEAAIQLAATMPKAYIELVTKSQPTQSRLPNQSPPRNHFTSAPAPTFKGWNHFEQMRKTNPNEYFKPSTQNEIMRLAGEHGDEFYNR